MDNENIKDVEFEETEVDETKVEATEEEEKVPTDETAETPEVVDEFADDDPEDESGEPDGEPDAEGSTESDGQSVSAIEDEDSTGITTKIVNVIVGEKTFELSLDDINYSINCLINEMYSETDNTYYMTSVYPESKYVIMIDMWNSSHAFKQSYKDRKGVYSLIGERIPVKNVWLTSDEEAELDKMRSNYSSIADKLSKYEAEPEKIEILNSADYASIANQADFAELKKQENHFDLTVDELKDKADAILLRYAKSGKLNFAAADQKKEEPKKDFFAFARTENTSFLDGLLNKK